MEDLTGNLKRLSCPSGTQTERSTDASNALRILLERAKAQVRVIPWHLVSSATLKLYTDASVLLAVEHFVHGLELQNEGKATLSPGSRARSWRETLKMLDKAIIVAGAKGPKRPEWIRELLANAQPFISTPPAPSRSRKRRRMALDSDAAPLFAPEDIRSIPPPSAAQYASDPALYAQPFILRKYIDWPALEKWQSAEYLLDSTGERYVPVEVGAAYDTEGWGQRITSWRKFLQRAGWAVEVESDSEEDGSDDDNSGEASASSESKLHPLYLAQTALFTQFPALERDFTTPEYVFSKPQLPGYTAPSDPLINVWVGSGSKEIVSPAHTDPYFNCYVQVLGVKRVWVVPPDVKGMAVHGDSADGELEQTASDLASEYMTNTSRVPLFREKMNVIRSRYPAFAESAYPHAKEAVLGPGDMLVLPPKWWHSMQGEGDGPCWSVSFWY